MYVMAKFIKPNTFSIFLYLVFICCLNITMFIITGKDVFANLVIIHKSGKEYWIGPSVLIIQNNITRRNNHYMGNMDKSKEYLILYWTNSFEKYGRKWFGLDSSPFSTCPVYNNCRGVVDKDMYNSSDAILMNMWFISRRHDFLPKYKLTPQKWIFHIMESPANEEDYSKYNNLFNVTWTYSRNSDISTSYNGYHFVKRKTFNIAIANRNYAKGKTKLVAWFVSNCGRVHSARWQYVTHLNYYIPVHIYGHCGTYTCERKISSECDEMLEKDYKFYLSFENSLCEDYVTEKLWRALNLDIIPIVLGAANYSSLLPPRSYIDIKDFKSPKHLAEYLMALDKNNTLYNSYLSWKEYFETKLDVPAPCKMCEYLNKSANRSFVYSNMHTYWSEKSVCYNPEDLYPSIDKRAWTWNTLHEYSAYLM